MNKNIIKSSEKFKKNKKRKEILINTVNNYLPSLNNLIESAYSNNNNKVITKLPSSFDIPESFSQKDFQTEFYYNIVTILEEKGYISRIKFSKDNIILIISWESKDSLKIDAMKKKLKNIMIN